MACKGLSQGFASEGDEPVTKTHGEPVAPGRTRVKDGPSSGPPRSGLSLRQGRAGAIVGVWIGGANVFVCRPYPAHPAPNASFFSFINLERLERFIEVDLHRLGHVVEV